MRFRWLAAVSAALLIAGCGGSGGSGAAVGATTEAPNSSSSPVGLSRCMRAHGLTNFPDPTAGPGREGFNGITRANVIALCRAAGLPIDLQFINFRD